VAANSVDQVAVADCAACEFSARVQQECGRAEV